MNFARENFKRNIKYFNKKINKMYETELGNIKNT